MPNYKRAVAGQDINLSLGAGFINDTIDHLNRFPTKIGDGVDGGEAYAREGTVFPESALTGSGKYKGRVLAAMYQEYDCTTPLTVNDFFPPDHHVLATDCIIFNWAETGFTGHNLTDPVTGASPTIPIPGIYGGVGKVDGKVYPIYHVWALRTKLCPPSTG